MSLYDPKLERDNCGFGLLAHMEGEASHKLVRLAMSALARMQHRGGISADGKTGDGCGLLLQKPDSFFRAVAEEKGWHLGRNYAVGMLFLNPDPILAQATRDIIDEELEKVWAGQASAEKGLKAAKQRSDAEIAKFAAANK